MLDDDSDEASQFLFTYYKPLDKNSIEQYEDDFIAQFQLIHDEIDEANKKLCKSYEEIYDVIIQSSKHKCVYCKKNIAVIAAVKCGHVLFCHNCMRKISRIEDQEIPCPVCSICYGIKKIIAHPTQNSQANPQDNNFFIDISSLDNFQRNQH